MAKQQDNRTEIHPVPSGLINFTKLALERLPIPEPGKRAVYRDTKTAGLQLRVTSSGVKTFSIFRRIKGGPPERITLERFPGMTVEQARAEAAKANAEIATGGNPADVKRAVKGEPTFADLFDAYLERHSKPHKRTWREDETKYRDYLAKPLGGRKVSHITRQQVAAIHDRITSDGHAIMANRVMALVSSVFGWGLSKSLCEANPAKGIKRNSETSRDRFLQSDELPRFFKALGDEPNESMRDFFLLSLLTGARRSNVLAMRWEDVNFERAEWRIGLTKNGDPQTVTLSAEVMEILRRRQPKDEETALRGQKPKKDRSAFVFSGTGKAGHLKEPRKGWERIFDRDELQQLSARINAAGDAFTVLEGEAPTQALRRARTTAKDMKLDCNGCRIADIRIHDLRRTLGSWQAKQGASLAIIGKSLNHKSQQTTAIYARLDTDPVRASVDAATAAMMEAGGMKKSAKVTRLHRAT
jgi:integrase